MSSIFRIAMEGTMLTAKNIQTIFPKEATQTLHRFFKGKI